MKIYVILLLSIFNCINAKLVRLNEKQFKELASNLILIHKTSPDSKIQLTLKEDKKLFVKIIMDGFDMLYYQLDEKIEADILQRTWNGSPAILEWYS